MKAPVRAEWRRIFSEHRDRLGEAALTPASMKVLEGYISVRLLRAGTDGNPLGLTVGGTVSTDDRVTVTVDSERFTGRPAVTFVRDGPVLFAPWADDATARPIMDGFRDWFEEIVRLGEDGMLEGAPPGRKDTSGRDVYFVWTVDMYGETGRAFTSRDGAVSHARREHICGSRARYRLSRATVDTGEDIRSDLGDITGEIVDG